MGLYDYNIYGVIKRNARVYKDRIALISESQKINYRQFLEYIDRLACGLSGAGLKKGDRIAILAQNSLEYVYLYGVAAKVGAIMIPINLRLAAEEIDYIIGDVDPKFLFVGAEFHTIMTPLISKYCFQDNCYSMGQASKDFASFNDLMNKNGICPEMDVNFDDEYFIVYTAAVYGKPRGATISHQNMIISNLQLMYRWNLTKEDTHILLLPLYHSFGLCITLSVMQAGGSNIITPKFDTDLALKKIQEDRVTLFGEFPPILDSLLDKAQEGEHDLSSLRIVLGLDRPDTIKRFERMTGATFWTAYAQAETTSFVSMAPYFERPGSAGTPSFAFEVEIMDDNGNFLETGKAGEIVVRGPMVFKGYLNLPIDNEYTFRDGWHHTGDIGRFDEDGYLWYEGRKAEKELIKSGGENVYPAEVEKVVLEHPLIQEVSVIGVPDKQWGEAIKAICVLRNGESLQEVELIEFVGKRIARFKRPKYIVFVQDLPKTKDGSIDRQKIKVIHGKA